MEFCNPDADRWAVAAATNKQFMETWGHLGDGTYNLFAPMSQFWHEANEYNVEVIWDRQHVSNVMAQTYDTYGGPVWIHGTYYTWGNYCPTQELVDDYQMANGLSISDPASGYDPQNPYVGREKRFYDFIVYDGAEYKQDWMSEPDIIYTRIDLVNPSKNQIDFGGDDVGTQATTSRKDLTMLTQGVVTSTAGITFTTVMQKLSLTTPKLRTKQLVPMHQYMLQSMPSGRDLEPTSPLLRKAFQRMRCVKLYGVKEESNWFMKATDSMTFGDGNLL